MTRLAQALALPKDDIVRDSAIQRFEISFELCWKFLKAYLEEEHNASCTSPRTCFRAALHGCRRWCGVSERFSTPPPERARYPSSGNTCSPSAPSGSGRTLADSAGSSGP